MKSKAALAAVQDPRATPQSAGPGPALAPHAHGATLEALLADGTLRARTDQGELWLCDCLDLSGLLSSDLAVGDRVLVVPLAAPGRPVVIGRIGRHGRPPQVRMEAGELLSLKCGESSIDLRADGKVVIRGEDVLVRAKGTQRIRAGAVSIN